PPNDLPPAAVESLLKKPGVPAGQDAFAATIMDLARMGYGEFAGKGRRFSMYVDMEREPEGLETFEKYALDFLRLAARRTRPERVNERGWRLVDNSGLKNAAKSQTSFLSRWGARVLSWLRYAYTRGRYAAPESALPEGAPAAGGRPRDSLVTPASRNAATVQSVVAIGAALLLGGTATIVEGPVIAGFIALAILTVIFGISTNSIQRWKDHVAPDVYGWEGFRRTLRDYTQMKDAPDDFFRLWDRYFVYAAALGVAKQYLKNVERLAHARGMTGTDLAAGAG